MGMVSKFNWVPCLFGFFLAIAYIPSVTGAAVPTGWFYLFLTIPLWAFFVQADLKNTHVYGLLFLIYIFVSLAWTFNLQLAYFFLMQMIVLAVVFYIGSTLLDLKPIVIGLTLGVAFSDLAALGQYFGFKQIFSLNGSVAGLFVNQNIFCEVSAVMLLCLVALKLWYWIPLTLPGLLFIHSRAAMLGVGVGLMLWGWRKDRLVTFAVALCCVMGGLIYYRDSNFFSIFERYYVWADTIRGFTLFGQGVGTYEILYPLYAINIDTYISRPKFAHNDLLQIVYEFGIGSVFLVLMILNIWKIKRDESIILYGIATISLFAYPFHVPMLAFIGVLVAGYLTRFDDTDWLVRDWRGLFLSKKLAT